MTAPGPVSDGEFSPLAEVPLMRSRVYRAILERIIAGHLRPGDRIIERDVAAQIGVSTTPVKEALRRLENEGFVQSFPRRGVVVGDAATSPLADIVAVRAALESLAARLAADRVRARTDASTVVVPASDEEIDALRRSTQSVMSPPGDAAGAATVNATFHDVVRRMSGNGFIVQMVGTLLEVDTVLRSRALANAQEIEIGALEHRRVGEAILRGDADDAAAQMHAHIIDSSERTSAGEILASPAE